MVKMCSICNEEVLEEEGKLFGTALKVKENNENHLIYVCSDCQKGDNWILKAKVRAA
jgi:hypothetical protein